MKSLLLIPFFCLNLFQDPPPKLSQVIEADLEYLIDFYQKRHRQPEVSLEEKETAKALAGELRSIGFEVSESVGGYGVVGMYKNGQGPTILYRTDMDALPITEKTGLDYASTDGEMHACGHDMHMTTWVGTARAMVKLKKDWKGTLMFIGQPAEEIGQGAKMMLDAGLYDRFGVPDYGLGLHVSPTIPAGQVGFGKGYTMANAEMINIKVFGVGSHGASPHMSVDPVVLASMMVMELQTIVSRTIDPRESAVVTVGAIQGGIRGNIIPDEVMLQLTVRTFEEEVRLKVHQRIREIARGTAIAAGLPEDKMPEVEIPEEFTPANFNDPELVDVMWETATEALGAENVVNTEPLMLGEDFACYGRTDDDVPTVLYWLGSVPEERIASGDLPGLHSPFYYPEPRGTIETGVTVMSQTMLRLFNGQK
ncbi:MAG: amidohydrolase [Bacteroidota bacterium]